ncbi:hypothetical protein D3C78_990340 [compost metagenome]
MGKGIIALVQAYSIYIPAGWQLICIPKTGCETWRCVQIFRLFTVMVLEYMFIGGQHDLVRHGTKNEGTIAFWTDVVGFYSECSLKFFSGGIEKILGNRFIISHIQQIRAQL